MEEGQEPARTVSGASHQARHLHHALRYLQVQVRHVRSRRSARAVRQWHLKSTMCDVTKRGSIVQHGVHKSTLPDPPVLGLNLTVKRLIRQKLEEKMKPSRILNSMIDQGFFSDDAAAFLSWSGFKIGLAYVVVPDVESNRQQKSSSRDGPLVNQIHRR